MLVGWVISPLWCLFPLIGALLYKNEITEKANITLWPVQIKETVNCIEKERESVGVREWAKQVGLLLGLQFFLQAGHTQEWDVYGLSEWIL